MDMDMDSDEELLYDDSEQSTYYSTDSNMDDEHDAHGTESAMNIIPSGWDDQVDYSEQSYRHHEYDHHTVGMTTTSFWQRYKCYPASFTEKHAHIETSDKIVMPPSALDVLSSLQIDYPMVFEFRRYCFDVDEEDKNNETETETETSFRVSHCGVWEFTAEEGFVYMPKWMMQNMKLQEGDLVLVQNRTLAKGTHVKLQPHTSDFLDISDPKAMLESTLRTFSCLTTGDTISLPYENKQYCMDIIETKPSNAIGIIDTDCEVDFAPPLDYKEPEKPVADLDAKVETYPVEEEPNKFSPFTGARRRVDGKHVEYEPVTNTNYEPPSTGSSSSRALKCRQTQGKVVLGAGNNANPSTTAKATSNEVGENQESKFLAFTGKMYSLS